MSSFRVSYQTIEFGNTDIHIRTLRDKQEYSDPEGAAEQLGICSANWSLFGVLWDSSKILAHVISTENVDNLKILEVGCGIGLASLLLNHRRANITATDYHPEVGAFLDVNTELNGDPLIPFVRTGWADVSSSLGQFDLIIGSDLLYEKEHAILLSDFIDKHALVKSEVIIVDPGRGNRNAFCRGMISHGFTVKEISIDDPSRMMSNKGKLLRFSRSK